MDALAPELSASLLAAFQPGSCQLQAREWLKSNNDIFLFAPERIHQRYALSVFYCETNGDAWLQNNSWLSDLHECDWFNGIGSDGCGRSEDLVVLRLPDNQLDGTLPPELSLVTSLRELTLSANFLRGTIPEEYVKLKALDTFSLSFNFLRGSIPDFLFKLQTMTYLDLSQNDFSGTIPEDLADTMPNVVAFSVNGNKRLDGIIHNSLEDSTN
jgi:hypothetical protein